MGASFVDHLPLAETAAHIHGATTDRALCLGVVECPLYLSHCAECSWILESHDTSDGHLLSFFFFFLIFICVAGSSLSCGMQDLRCVMWDPLFSALTPHPSHGGSLVTARGLQTSGAQ